MGRLSTLNRDDLAEELKNSEFVEARLGQALLLLRRFYNGIEMSHLTIANARASKRKENLVNVVDKEEAAMEDDKEEGFKSREDAIRAMEYYFRFSRVNARLSYNLAEDVYRFLSRFDQTFCKTTLRRQQRFLSRQRKEKDHQRPCLQMCPFRTETAESVRTSRGLVPGEACPYFRQLHGFGVYCEPMMGKIIKMREAAKAQKEKKKTKEAPKATKKLPTKPPSTRSILRREAVQKGTPAPTFDPSETCAAQKKKATKVAERKRPVAARLRTKK